MVLSKNLIIAIDEISSVKKRHPKLKDQIQDGEKSRKTIMDSKTQAKEAKCIKYVLNKQLKRNISECEKLESRIVSLRKELNRTKERLSKNMKIYKSLDTLEDLNDSQVSPFVKSGFGFTRKSLHITKQLASKN